jgi:hypothetical protein
MVLIMIAIFLHKLMRGAAEVCSNHALLIRNVAGMMIMFVWGGVVLLRITVPIPAGTSIVFQVDKLVAILFAELLMCLVLITISL